MVRNSLNGTVMVLILNWFDVAEDEEGKNDEGGGEETHGVGAPVGGIALVVKTRERGLTHEHVPLARDEASQDNCGDDDPKHESSVAMHEHKLSSYLFGEEERTWEEEGKKTAQKLNPVQDEYSNANPGMERPKAFIASLCLPPNHKDEASNGTNHGKGVENGMHYLLEKMISWQHLKAKYRQAAHSQE